MTARHAASSTSPRRTGRGSFDGAQDRPAISEQPSPPQYFDDLDLEGLPQLCQALRSREFLTFLGSEPLRFNQLAHIPCAGSLPLRPADRERVGESFDRYLAVNEKLFFRGTTATIASALSIVARENSFHPVAEYLEKLVWDGKSRLARLAAEVLDVDPGSSEAASQLIRKWCISAVARAFQPGSPVEGTLVLVGSGRLPSDIFFRMLIPLGLYVDVPAESFERTRVQLRRAWVYAFPDIAKRTQGLAAGALASFLDDLEDEVEGPFAVPDERAPRLTVFAATADDLPIVMNPGLAHRLWGVQVGMDIDADKLVSWRDQLWAEAVSQYRAGVSWLLTPEEDGHRLRLGLGLPAPDPWQGYVFEFMKAHEQPRIEDVLGYVFTALHGFDHGTTEWTMGEQRRAGAILRSMGYLRRPMRSGGERHKRWVRCEEPGEARNEGGEGGEGGR